MQAASTILREHSAYSNSSAKPSQAASGVVTRHVALFSKLEETTTQLKLWPSLKAKQLYASNPLAQDPDILNKLPAELAVMILSYLSIKELAIACRISSSWMRLCSDNYLWSLMRKRIELPFLGNTSINRKYQLREDLKTLKSFKALYTPELIEALGGEKAFSKIPFLKPLRDTVEFPFLKGMISSKEITAPIMRGAQPVPFITVCYKTRLHGNPSHHTIEIISRNSSGWLSIACDGKRCLIAPAINSNLWIDYLGRLAKGEPCGILESGQELAPLTEGKSTVYLSDPKEGILQPFLE